MRISARAALWLSILGCGLGQYYAIARPETATPKKGGKSTLPKGGGRGKAPKMAKQAKASKGVKESSNWYGSWCQNSDDVILEWNCVALEANVLDHNGPEVPGSELSLTQGPPSSARALAMVHIAMFDAYCVAGGKFTTYLKDVRDQVDGSGASAEAAVARAAHRVMTELYASVREIVDMCDTALEKTLERLNSQSAIQKGLQVGEAVGQMVLDNRRDDGYSADNPYLMNGTAYLYEPTGELGVHDVDPVNPGQGFFSPGAGYMTPFGMSGEQMDSYRAPIPPGLVQNEQTGRYVFDPSNQAYIDAVLEVKEKGAFRGGMAGDPFPVDASYDIGNFWSYNGSPGLGTPPRLCNLIARQVAGQMDNSVDDNAVLFALVNVGLADAGITAWDSKFHYSFWRPVLGVRNHPMQPDATIRDANWVPLGASRSNIPEYPNEMNFSPPFPAYTSGHATFGAVALKILHNFYQSAAIPFTFVSEENNGKTTDQFGRVRPLKPRTYDTFTIAMSENAASRVFNGVHWRFDGTQGVAAGNKVADYLYTNLFLPEDGPARSPMPDGNFKDAIDCILREPEYQDLGLCKY